MIGGAIPAHEPMAVRLLDIDEGVTSLKGCSGYASALVFFRRRGTIIGRELLDTVQGAIPGHVLQARVDAIDAEGSAFPQDGGFRRTSHPHRPLVTVAVCTRDRTGMLRGCIESLVALQWRPIEILVVDNCPSDDSTKRLVSEFPSVRYALCRRPGLNRARNLALSLARGDIVAFTDDDARVDPTWASNLVKNFEEPIVALVTGITLPAELETPAQVEFELGTSFIRGYRRRQFTMFSSHPFHVAGIGAGANMAIRMSMVKDIGLFDEYLDGGTPTRSGGDHEFFFRALARGYRIVYDPSAVAWHFHKRTPGELVSTMYGYGVGVFAWWTKTLIIGREYSMGAFAPFMLIQYHVSRWIASILRKPGSAPLPLSWAELRGAMAGPFAYVRSRLSVDS